MGEKREQTMRGKEEKGSFEMKQHSNFIPTTPPHTPNFTSTTSTSSCSGVNKSFEIGSQAELERREEQDKISQEDLQEDSSFDSEVDKAFILLPPPPRTAFSFFCDQVGGEKSPD